MYLLSEYIIYGLIAWAFVNIFGTNIAIHRFMAHRSFKTGAIREKDIKILNDNVTAFGGHYHGHHNTDIIIDMGHLVDDNNRKQNRLY